MDPTPPVTRACTSCRAVLPLTDAYFHRHSGPGFYGFQYVCKSCKRTELAAYYRTNPRIRQMQYNRRHRTLRLAALLRYSAGDPACACCGERTPDFLAIDHINGNGGVRHGERRRSGKGLYEWLRAQGYPEGFRVLCHNCNHALGMLGYCPHHPPPGSA